MHNLFKFPAIQTRNVCGPMCTETLPLRMYTDSQCRLVSSSETLTDLTELSGWRLENEPWFSCDVITGVFSVPVTPHGISANTSHIQINTPIGTVKRSIGF
jgi:hypothetical protein